MLIIIIINTIVDDVHDDGVDSVLMCCVGHYVTEHAANQLM